MSPTFISHCSVSGAVTGEIDLKSDRQTRRNTAKYLLRL